MNRSLIKCGELYEFKKGDEERGMCATRNVCEGERSKLTLCGGVCGLNNNLPAVRSPKYET